MEDDDDDEVEFVGWGEGLGAGDAVAVKDTPILFASEEAYEGGKVERWVDSQPMTIGSAMAIPLSMTTEVVFR